MSACLSQPHLAHIITLRQQSDSHTNAHTPCAAQFRRQPQQLEQCFLSALATAPHILIQHSTSAGGTRSSPVCSIPSSLSSTLPSSPPQQSRAAAAATSPQPTQHSRRATQRSLRAHTHAANTCCSNPSYHPTVHSTNRAREQQTRAALPEQQDAGWTHCPCCCPSQSELV